MNLLFTKFRSILKYLWAKTRSYDPKAFWTAQGETYKQKYHERFEKRLHENGYDRNISVLLSTLRDYHFNSILDVGCGYGLYLQAIEREFPELAVIQGCDISPTQLEQAREFLGTATRVKLDETDGVHLPYPDKHFDIVITYGVCVLVPDKSIKRFISENLRVAKQAYIFIESNLTTKYFGYFSHDYPSLFEELGVGLRIIKVLDSTTNEKLYVADLGKG